MSDWQHKEGDLVGLNWKIPAPKSDRHIRFMYADVNYWKTFVANRWTCPMGQPGCLSIFGKPPLTLKEKADQALDNPLMHYADRNAPNEDHRMIFEHMMAEYSIKTEGRGRVVNEWAMKPRQTENHLFDCLVGCCVAASLIGVRLSGHSPIEAQRPKRKKRIWKAKQNRKK